MDEDDILARRIKDGCFKNRNIGFPCVTLAHDVFRLRKVLDGQIAELQAARAALDMLGMPYHLRFWEMDMHVMEAHRKGADEVSEVERLRRRNPNIPIIPLRR